MGELYARFKLGVTQTPYVYGGYSVPYIYDSQGYSLADVLGEQYLVQALTSLAPAGWPHQGSVNGATVAFAWGQFHPPQPVNYDLGLNATAVKTISHLHAPPPVPNIGPLPNDIARVNIYNEYNSSLYGAMGLTATYSGDFMVVANDVDPAGVIPGYLASLESVPFEFVVNSGYGYITFTAEASLPGYLWLDLGSHDPVLFDSGPDFVDFNNLSDAERSMISAGSPIYNGFGGDDIVSLPNRANFNADMGDGKTLGWTASALSTFNTGSSDGQTYTIIAGDGDYFLKFGAGTDILKISPVTDSSYVTEVIDSFSEKDVIDFVRRPNLILDRPSGHERDWVNVYSGDMLAAVLKFTNSVTAGGLVSMDDGAGGTMIVFVGIFTEQADNVDFNHLTPLPGIEWVILEGEHGKRLVDS